MSSTTETFRCTPRISIGLPVYNGGDQLRKALESLLAQDEPNFELIISDNASTDGITPVIINEFAAADARIRVIRQAENIGAFGNFQYVASQARADYFLWAAHDDLWSPNYLSTLAAGLDQHPAAVLATPVTQGTRLRRDGRTQQVVTPAAPGQGRWPTLDQFVDHQACCWIYGLFRRPWLQANAPLLATYPHYAGDFLWLYRLLLTESVVGCPDATYYRVDPDGKYDRLLTPRYRFEVYRTLLREAWRLCRAMLPPSERRQGFSYMLRYVSRRYVSRGHLLGTGVRVMKLGVMGAWWSLTDLVRRSRQAG